MSRCQTRIDDLEQLILRNPPALQGDLGQGAAPDVGHDEIRRVVGLEAGQDGDDIRVPELGDGSRLLDELRLALGKGGKMQIGYGHDLGPGGLSRGDLLGHELLDGDLLLQHLVVGEVRNPEPARPELPADDELVAKHRPRPQGTRVEGHAVHVPPAFRADVSLDPVAQAVRTQLHDHTTFIN
jgi:hypothetical protein